ncbi:MAG: hypothetical protein WDO19_19635 [Bacteroidota bacterium]
MKEVRLQASVSANVVTYVTIIDAPNADMKLKPGMTASITVYTEEAENALIIPVKAIKFKPDTLLSQKYTIERPAGPGIKKKIKQILPVVAKIRTRCRHTEKQ